LLSISKIQFLYIETKHGAIYKSSKVKVFRKQKMLKKICFASESSGLPAESEEKKSFIAATLASGELSHLNLLKKLSDLFVNARKEGTTGYQLIELINCTIELAGVKQTPESKLLKKEIEKVIAKFILGH